MRAHMFSITYTHHPFPHPVITCMGNTIFGKYFPFENWMLCAEEVPSLILMR